MGDFIGGVGAAFIMAAAAAVIVKFLLDINVIKNRDNVIKYGKVSLAAITVGIIYVSAAALMYNEINGQTNFFAFDKIFAFFGTDKLLTLCQTPDLKEMFGGALMPLYPCLVHITGRAVFEQYVLTAQFISFLSTVISSCMLYKMIDEHTDNTESLMLFCASLPYVFMLFTPSYISLMTAFIVSAGYALSKEKIKTFIVLSLLAALTGKAGIIAFLLYPLKGSLRGIVRWAENILLKNKIVFRVILTLLLLFNSGALYCLIKGVGV